MKKRSLCYLFLLPPGVWCVILLSVALWDLAMLYLAVTALGLGLSKLMLCLTRDGLRWLRLVPLTLLAVPLGLAWRELNSHGFLSDLAAMMWLLIALCGLCGWCAAWATAPGREPGRC